MNGWSTVALLVVSNVFMTFAWYGQLKLSEIKVVTPQTPLWLIVIGSWMVALVEYCFSTPANRYGFAGNGGAFSLVQLKVIQEVVSLVVFTAIAIFVFRGQSIQWNHLAAFGCIVLAVYFVFMD